MPNIDDLPCPHSRPSWTMCPHCLGINQAPQQYVVPPAWTIYTNPNKEQYERDSAEKQKKHLDSIRLNNNQTQIYEPSWKPCVHNSCTECVGTGIKKDGSLCIHNIYCDCPKCTIYCSV